MSGAARAQQSGDTLLQLGWIHAQGLNPRTAVHTDLRHSPGNTLLGVPDSFDTPGITSQARSVETLALWTTYFVSDHVSLELEAGFPPKVEVKARGIAAPPGPSGNLFRIDLGDPALNPLASSRQWSPVVSLQYHFGVTAARWRPFAGAGITYTWFTETRLNPAFAQAINSNFGQPLAVAAGKPGPTSTRTSVAPLWAPAFKLGLGFSMTSHWGLTGGVVYVPYSTTTTTLINAADGTTLATNQARIKVDALALALLIQYRL